MSNRTQAKKLNTALQMAADFSRRVGGTVALEVEYDGGMIPVATIELYDAGDHPGEKNQVRGLPKRRKHCRWEEVKVGLVQQPGAIDRLYW